jgi:hypothetical protein
MGRLRLLFSGSFCSAVLLCSCAMPARAGVADASPVAAPVRDGSHDFDFLYGTWLMHNRRLKPPVLSSHDWARFDSTDEAHALPGGLGNEDFYRSSYPRKGFVGMTVRLYDRTTGLWRIYWIDNRQSHGDAGAPNVGRWRGNVGIFDEHLMVAGKPAIDRYTWTLLGEHSRITAHFAESLSIDGGKTWKVIFVNDLIRSGPVPGSRRSAP